MERTIKIWLDGEVIEQFDFDFDEDMTEDDMIQATVEYIYGNLDVEVV